MRSVFNLQKELQEPISSLKGVGRKRAACFLKLGIRTCFDLICHFPVDYDDCSRLSLVKETVHGNRHCVRAKIIEKLGLIRTKSLKVMRALAVDEEGYYFHLVVFNSEFFFKNLKLFDYYIFFGKIEKYGERVQMLSPKIILKSEMGFVAKYGLASNLTNRIISSQIKQVLSSCQVAENLPKSLVLKFNLVERSKAFFNIHFPASKTDLFRARNRLIFEELFFWQLSLKILKKFQLKRTKVALNETNLDEFLKVLPFRLSNSQIEVIDECVADCVKNIAMNRLIQGDVGCGKTVIVQALCYLFVKSGFQVAFMAPTEILARQHYNNFKNLFSKLQIEVGFLAAALKKSQQLSVLNDVAVGKLQILVGTHSLFSERTVFKNLGLVVTDEQHRFGVVQRSSLTKKGHAPHVLIMSATPVPRTLAMVFFADVDVSIVRHAPVGKAKIKTFHVPPSKRSRVFSFLSKEVAKGRQAYVVCPLIDGSGVKKAISVEPYFKKLKTLKEFEKIKIAMLHGKQTSEQKANLMNQFIKGELDVLVATSIVEVGIDNPNATVIVVENAEMFGLASLHQLRGRVGRGSFDSFCILISYAKSEQAKNRMRAMCEFESGFEISRVDLSLRGPGHFFGTQQHGMIDFKIANLIKNFGLLQVCNKEAGQFLNDENMNRRDMEILNELKFQMKNSLLVL